MVERKENALNIKSFEGDKLDNELNKLYEFLSNFEEEKDVRKVDKENWKIE